MKLKIKSGKETAFWAGIIMMLVGLVIFFSHIYVASNMISSGFQIGGLHMSTGVILVPFIIGVICMFIKPNKKWPVYIAAGGILLMIITAMLSVNIRVRRMAMAMWIIVLVLIFGGLVLVIQSVSLGKK